MFNFGNDAFMNEWQKMMSEWFGSLTKNPEFLQNVGKSVDSALTSKTFIDELKNKMLQSASMPTAAQSAKIGQYIIRLEGKIADLEDLIHEQSRQIETLKNIIIHTHSPASEKSKASTVKAKKPDRPKTAKTRAKKGGSK